MDETENDDAPTHDQDAEPASVPSGAAAETNAAEEEDQDAGPASGPGGADRPEED